MRNLELDELGEIHLVEIVKKPRTIRKPRVWKTCILCDNEFRTIEQEVCQDCHETKKYLEYLRKVKTH